MLSESQALVGSALLTWLMIMTASSLRSKIWTPQGARLAFGNREQVPEATGLAGRADRAAKNMLENFVLFAGVMLAAHAAARSGGRVALGATVFFWSRVVYWPVYLAGVTFVRSGLWAVGVSGIALVASAVV